MTTSLRDVVSRWPYVLRTCRLCWDAAPSWTLARVVLLVMQGLLPVGTVYLSRFLVDSLVAAIGLGGTWQSLQPILVLAALMAGVLLLSELLQSAMDWIHAAQAELIQDHINALVHAKSIAVDLSFYESSDYYDRLDRARSNASSRSLGLLESAGTFVQSSITLLALAGVLLPYGVWLPLVLLVSTLPALYVVLCCQRRQHQWWAQTTANRRWIEYYDVVLTVDTFAAELRLFDLGAHFRSAYQALRQRLRTERLQLLKHQGVARLLAGMATLVVSGAAMVWMVWRAVQGFITLGDLALFYQAFQRGQSLLHALLGNVGQLYSHSLFLENLFEFLALKPHVTDPPRPRPAPAVVQQGVCFRQVTFHYPGSERAALDHFSLTIPAGQAVAIVGANGAGKSTLIKLLCRFYDPEAGHISVDGTDIRDLALQDLRRLITVLFQFPVDYHATAAQNIALGDLPAAPNATDIAAAARSAGAHAVIARLPQGYDTLLGKWFADGTELSGGEWQRLALARAFLRQAQLVVLDEPTSFMDSWAEVDWLERFRALVRGRTALIITHRFTTAMCADVIHVMHEGQIVESGGHEALLAQGGRYAQSWSAQMRLSLHQTPAHALPDIGRPVTPWRDGAVIS